MFSNLLGVAGLIAIAAAVGGLTGNWWWSALAGGSAAVVLAVLAQWNATRAAEESPADVRRLHAQSTAPRKPSRSA